MLISVELVEIQEMGNLKSIAMNTDQMVRAVSAPIDNHLNCKYLTLHYQVLDTYPLPLPLQNHCIDLLDFMRIDYLPFLGIVTGLPEFEFSYLEKLFCVSISSCYSS